MQQQDEVLQDVRKRAAELLEERDSLEAERNGLMKTLGEMREQLSASTARHAEAETALVEERERFGSAFLALYGTKARELDDARRIIEAGVVAFVDLGDADSPVANTWGIAARRVLARAPATAPAPDAQPLSSDVLHDMLSLVIDSDREHLPSMLAISAWTDDEREAAAAWAAACYAQASDHDDVIVPPKPACIDRPDPLGGLDLSPPPNTDAVDEPKGDGHG